MSLLSCKSQKRGEIMTINNAIIGLGNVASALIQGVEHYKEHPESIIGILPEITEINLEDFRFSLAFDVHKDKVGKNIAQALFIKPNCAMKITQPDISGPVLKGPELDGLDSNIREHIPVSKEQTVNVKEELEKRNIDVVVILLPTGSNEAAKFYAKEAIEAGCAVINGMPALIANDKELVALAEKENVSIIGDDVKSQIGATIIHRALSNLFPMRGAILNRTIQLDWGGDMDFCNLTSNNRYEKGKRQ